MIISVKSVGINVGDQDRAKEFWTQVIGFELLGDTPMGENGGPRWIEIAPPDKRVVLVLFTPDVHKDRIGTFSNIVFECDDLQAAYEQLSAKGVEFPDPPRHEPWGWWATFKDPDGNTYGLSLRSE